MRISVRIEMDRGRGWEVRQHGEFDHDRDAAIDSLRTTLPAYCVQFPHRALVDGEVVAEATP